MTFTKFVCWNLANVRQVMDVEATQPPNHIFLATHYPIKMYRKELIKANVSGIPYNEEQFLKDFLAEKDFAFVPVLGNSGTGKSHLIRWLAAKIPSTNKRRVLLIPKIGTNLKDIINLILQDMQGEKFDEYRQRVNKATNTLTETQARVQLLNQLAAAVGDHGQRDKSQLTEEEIYLIENLDSLLYDPFFREYWLKDDSIIDRLVIHILGKNNQIEIIEERRKFSLQDLPLNVLNLQKAGAKAQEFYGFLISDDDIQKATIDWLNKHLDTAITQVLNLGREDLKTLMRDVRETLAEQGIELVLLIEDFAKLQGIDREVLEAVLAKPQQPGSKPLSAMRTALACTTGYFKDLDTVQQRFTFSVDLDVNLDIENNDEQSLITDIDIQKFTANYLNAVRLEDGEILHSINYQEPLKNACDDCEHRTPCHAGFGAVNNVGLYPFNSIALKQMFTKVNQKEFTKETNIRFLFNPRILIKDVLKYTLENGLNNIENGRFPSPALQTHFGRMRLSAIIQQDIETKDPQNYNRRLVLLDLWDNGNQLCDLPPELHTAFNLPPLGLTITQNKQSEQNKSVVKESKQKSEYKTNSEPLVTAVEVPEIPKHLLEKLKVLDNWNNQNILPQEIGGNLRKPIFDAIINRIQWENEMLLRTTFASSSSKYFKQGNIEFDSPRKTRRNISGVKLTLPLNPDDRQDFRDTAIAFQGILLFEHYQSWNFKDSDRYFLTYSKQLEKWCQYILEAIRLYPRESGELWNPVPAAVELLAITATMSGNDTTSIDKLINALFLEIDDKNNLYRAASWKKLFNTLQRYQSELLAILTSRIACTKGSSKDFQIIDSTQIIEPLTKIIKSGKPEAEIPNDCEYDIFDPIYKARKQVDQLLETAINEETTRQLEIYQLLLSELGENFKKKDVIEKLKTAIAKAREAAVFCGKKKPDEITELLEQFQRNRISKYMESMQRLQSEKENPNINQGKILQYLAEDYQKVMTDTQNFIDHNNNFLDASLNEVQQNIQQLENTDGVTVENTYGIIENGLTNLRSLILELKGS
ncbi:MAG: hypothetical protein RLZZ507_2010 [Cyanobacteriota bacterium]|jgi:hypothetical protein